MEQAIVIENIDALKKRIGNAGFGDRFNKEIDEALAGGKTEIRLFTSEVIENKRMDFAPEIKITKAKVITTVLKEPCLMKMEQQ